MGNTITVIGLGAGDLEQMPLGVYKQLKEAPHLFLRTKEHPVVKELENEGIEFKSFDHLYEQASDFSSVYREIVNQLWKESETNSIVYAVPGHPLVAEQTVQLLLQEKNDQQASVVLNGGQSFLDAMFQVLQIDPIEGFQLLDGVSLTAEQPNLQQHVIIAQVYDSFTASHVKLLLMERYSDDYPVTVVTAAGTKQESLVTVPLYELDRHVEVNNLTAIYLAPIKDSALLNREFSTLKDVIRTLRGPNGCPWDKKQTHESLRKYLLEEAYEVIEAIDEEDDDHLAEELGDVLLQVMLHSQIGEDEGYFTVEDVIESITEKMIRRHPHVFGDEKLSSPEEVTEVWNEIKKAEKSNDKQESKSLLDTISKSIPTLTRAELLQKKAAKVGFDWKEAEPIHDKIHEELKEFQDAVDDSDRDRMEAEFGDCLFALVNLARYYKVDPQLALGRTNRKFYDRFRYIEQELTKQGISFDETNLEEMDVLWEQAKILPKKKESTDF
ncbi:nucleoside triphosphate pyrophosphohydrolase [Alkalihalobacillus sp. AL-G]|uniref:nucleoside triphosphate pyrophosphohydrolase n=1 Tax=Alkalihalobacillus sp. AL-G TaxID=2926399 RepID=UPI00272CCFEC|nr:nucleoside triphosphate pyrophosphohydrolase [Alkalihalobacillus sp. AL-G]WLD93468.1 nucleoside triphosphate pyrophosphohydrolase [Alkalihalobacillus sp. AL-G]